LNNPSTELGFTPDWPTPTRVKSFITYRTGGHSCGNFQSNNLAAHVEDDPALVAANRTTLSQFIQLTGQPLWLTQVHGNRVVDLAEIRGTDSPASIKADGATSRESGVVCAVLTADCLPILLCDSIGSQVAAVHGGWRGLAQGIVAEAVAQFTPGSSLMAYLGPAISQDAYEIGDEVVSAFSPLNEEPDRFARANPQRPGHYFLDLYEIAKIQLRQQGVAAIFGGDRCCYGETEKFYSYRRDGQTGRMASLIWLA